LMAFMSFLFINSAGRGGEELQNVLNTLFTGIELLLGEADYEAMSRQASTVQSLGKTFYLMFTLFMVLILVNTFVAILNNAYDAAAEVISDHFDEEEMDESILVSIIDNILNPIFGLRRYEFVTIQDGTEYPKVSCCGKIKEGLLRFFSGRFFVFGVHEHYINLDKSGQGQQSGCTQTAKEDRKGQMRVCSLVYNWRIELSEAAALLQIVYPEPDTVSMWRSTVYDLLLNGSSTVQKHHNVLRSNLMSTNKNSGLKEMIKVDKTSGKYKNDLYEWAGIEGLTTSSTSTMSPIDYAVSSPRSQNDDRMRHTDSQNEAEPAIARIDPGLVPMVPTLGYEVYDEEEQCLKGLNKDQRNKDQPIQWWQRVLLNPNHKEFLKATTSTYYPKFEEGDRVLLRPYAQEVEEEVEERIQGTDVNKLSWRSPCVVRSKHQEAGRTTYDICKENCTTHNENEMELLFTNVKEEDLTLCKIEFEDLGWGPRDPDDDPNGGLEGYLNALEGYRALLWLECSPTNHADPPKEYNSYKSDIRIFHNEIEKDQPDDEVDEKKAKKKVLAMRESSLYFKNLIPVMTSIRQQVYGRDKTSWDSSIKTLWELLKIAKRDIENTFYWKKIALEFGRSCSNSVFNAFCAPNAAGRGHSAVEPIDDFESTSKHSRDESEGRRPRRSQVAPDPDCHSAEGNAIPSEPESVDVSSPQGQPGSQRALHCLNHPNATTATPDEKVPRADLSGGKSPDLMSPAKFEDPLPSPGSRQKLPPLPPREAHAQALDLLNAIQAKQEELQALQADLQKKLEQAV